MTTTLDALKKLHRNGLFPAPVRTPVEAESTLTIDHVPAHTSEASDRQPHEDRVVEDELRHVETVAVEEVPSSPQPPELPEPTIRPRRKIGVGPADWLADSSAPLIESRIAESAAEPDESRDSELDVVEDCRVDSTTDECEVPAMDGQPSVDAAINTAAPEREELASTSGILDRVADGPRADELSMATMVLSAEQAATQSVSFNPLDWLGPSPTLRNTEVDDEAPVEHFERHIHVPFEASRSPHEWNHSKNPTAPSSGSGSSNRDPHAVDLAAHLESAEASHSPSYLDATSTYPLFDDQPVIPTVDVGDEDEDPHAVIAPPLSMRIGIGPADAREPESPPHASPELPAPYHHELSSPSTSLATGDHEHAAQISSIPHTPLPPSPAAAIVAEPVEEPAIAEVASLVTVPATEAEQRLLNILKETTGEAAIRGLRDEINARCQFRFPTVMMASSARSSTRTADILIQLAMILCESQEEILIVDANLGEQTITRFYEVLDEPGLCDVLRRRVPAWEIVRPTSRAHVWMVACGDDVDGVSRVPQQLDLDTLREVLALWQHHFHRVLIDVGTPDSTLAGAFGPLADAAVLVVSNPVPSPEQLREASTQLARKCPHVVGYIGTDMPR